MTAVHIHPGLCVSAQRISHKQMDESFGLLMAMAPEEKTEPADGKNLQYYRDRFANASSLSHKRWFARAALFYIGGLR